MSEPVGQLLAALAGLAILLVSAGLALHAERARVERRLRAFLGGQQARTASTIERARWAGRPSARRPLLRRIGLGVDPLLLRQAGLSLSARRFLGVQVLTGLAGFGLARLAADRVDLDGLTLPAALAAGTMVGLWLPRVVLRICRGRRLRRAERQFPIAVDNLANGIQAGLSLPQALDAVGRDLPAPIGLELSQVIRETGMGLPFEEALDGIAQRVPLNDVELFVSAVHIQHRTGGNLSDILRSMAETVRERLRIRGEIHSLTAQTRLSAYLVSALPPAMALYIKFSNPSYFEKLLEPGTMRMLLIGGGVSLLAGFFVMMRIADIEV